MKQGALFLVCGALAASSFAWGAGGRAPAQQLSDANPLSDMKLHLEVDWPDLATELVLESESEEPLAQLSLHDTAGVPLCNLDPATFGGIGVAELAVEATGIPLAQALATYPEGRYLVRGRTLSGALVQAMVPLSHRFPGPFQVLPVEQAGPSAPVTIAWTPSLGAKRYLLEVENDELGESFEFALGAHRTSVTLPPGLVVQGQTYEVSLASEGDTDNQLEIETGFQAK
jgi:hypothetical protein